MVQISGNVADQVITLPTTNQAVTCVNMDRKARVSAHPGHGMASFANFQNEATRMCNAGFFVVPSKPRTPRRLYLHEIKEMFFRLLI